MTDVSAVIGRIQTIQDSIASTRSLASGAAFSAALSSAMAPETTGVTPPGAGLVPGNPLTLVGLEQALALGTVGTPTDGGTMVFPVAGGSITSDFGPRVHPITGENKMHEGVDIPAATGAPILAAAGGTVKFAGVMSGYGNVVIIDHGNGMETLYAHQNSIGVQVGQRVTAAQQIGEVGATGLATGPHLHFEVSIDGESVDPRPYL